MNKKNILRRIFVWLSEHNTLIQLLLLLGLTVFQVIFSYNFDIGKMIITAFIFIAIELLQINIVLEAYTIKTFSRNTSILNKRKSDTIKKYIEEAKNEVYITGMSNIFVVRYLLNNMELLELCLQRKITIKMLFVDCNDFDFNDKTYEFHFGKGRKKEEHDKFAKSEYNSSINVIKSNDCFKKLLDVGLIELKMNKFVTTTAYLACDPEDKHGQIQCQFYQYSLESSECPTALINSSDEIYNTIKESLLKLWTDSDDIEI